MALSGFRWMRRRLVRVVTAAVLGTLLLGLTAAPASAHCDHVNGPVVTAARAALANGNVRLVLPYVKPADETELTRAFEAAAAARQQGGKAAELAETYFSETAVRLHRKGEGAPYTGLKYEGDYGPALHAAEEALQSGRLDEVTAVLEKTLQHGLEERLHAVLTARERARKAGTVEAERERAEAELLFELYVHALHQAALGEAAHAEGGSEDPDLGHQHDEVQPPTP